jgi:hypothetical protein
MRSPITVFGSKIPLVVGLLLLILSAISGYSLTGDGPSYLGMAEWLRSTGSLFRDAPVPEQRWFSVWPLGYPMGIAAVSLLTSLPVYFAAKLLGAGTALITFGAARTVVGETRPAVGWWLLLGPFMVMWTAVLSEGMMFAAGTVAVALVVHGLREPHPPRWLIPGLALSVFLAFVVRYAGLSILGWLWVVSLVAVLAGRRDAARRLGVAAAGATAMVGAYLWMNLLFTGSATGGGRPPAGEGAGEVLKMLALTLLTSGDILTRVPLEVGHAWVHLIGWLAAFLLVWQLRAAASRPTGPAPSSESWLSNVRVDRLLSPAGLFLLLALAYAGLLLILRLKTHFDPLYTRRLVAPFTGWCLLAILSSGAAARLWASRRWVLVSLGAVAASTQLIALGPSLSEPGGWSAGLRNWQEARIAAQRFPARSILVFDSLSAPEHLHDLWSTYPASRPYAVAAEPWGPFADRLLATGRPVFVRVVPSLSETRYDPSVPAFMAAHEGATWIRLDTGSSP